MESRVARPGYKFIVVLTLPSGAKFAMGMHDKYFALKPIPADGNIMGAIAWDTVDQVENFLDKLRKENGEDFWANLQRMKPEYGQVKISQ